MHDGVIRSDARMTYTAVNAIVTEKDPETIAKYRELVPMFELMRELFEVLNARRHRRGSVDFDLPEAQVILNEDGFISDIVASERNVAHRLIEEFMLLANETVASHLENAAMPALYRIHEPPDPLKVLQFEEFISGFGFTLGASESGTVKPTHFQKLVEKIRGNPAERPIAFLMLRTMQKARYDADQRRPLRPGGADLHALHLADSPLSRPGRAPAAARGAAAPRSATSGRRSSTRSCRKWAATPPRWSAAPPKPSARSCSGRRSASWPTRSATSFDGYITGVAPFGMFVELIEHYVEGLVHVTTMADDYYRYREQDALAVWREHQARPTGSAIGCACRSSRSTWSAGRSISGSRTCSRRSAATSARAVPQRSSARPKTEQRKGTPEERRKRKQRPGKNERRRSKK